MLNIEPWQITWILAILKDFQIDHSKLALPSCANQATLDIVENQVFHERMTKHIEMDCHVLRDKVQEGELKLLHVTLINIHRSEAHLEGKYQRSTKK